MLNVERELKEFAEAVVKKSKSNLINNNGGRSKLASKRLYRSIDYDLTASKSGFSFSLDFEMAPYGQFVDKGVSGTERKYQGAAGTYRNSSKPPTGHILKWVNIKRLSLRDSEGRFVKGGRLGLAVIIARNIKKKGIKPSLFFTNAFEKHFKGLDKELQEAYALDLEEFMDFTLNK